MNRDFLVLGNLFLLANEFVSFDVLGRIRQPENRVKAGLRFPQKTFLSASVAGCVGRWLHRLPCVARSCKTKNVVGVCCALLALGGVKIFDRLRRADPNADLCDGWQRGLGEPTGGIFLLGDF